MTYDPPRCVVYRLYRQRDGVLIYVGSTGRWGLRMSQHERKQWWWSQVGDIKLQECASRQEAYLIEDIAIEREKPLYNKRRNFAQKVAAERADEDAYKSASSTVVFMAPAVYLLGKWAVRHMRWQVEARRARLTGGEFPQPVLKPFFEDAPANKIMMAALVAAPGQGIQLPAASRR